MFKSKSIQNTFVCLSLITTFGVFLHESKLDQATTVALAIPLGMSLALAQTTDAKPKLKSDGHPHVERAMLDRATRKGNAVPPRHNDRKHSQSKHTKGFNDIESHTLVLSADRL